MKMYMVGGCVRDRLLGLHPKDIDYVVVGGDEATMLEKGFKKVGADFPVFLDASGTEFALARTERKSGKGYNGFAVSTENVTLEDDLLRRDLTVNAIAFDADTGQYVDPYGGLKDLTDKVLRHVSDAFADDPVRVLRLARFAARYGSEWTVAPETMELCKLMVERGELDHLTRERVVGEFKKALTEKTPSRFFSVLWECGALQAVFPEFWSPSKMLSRWLTADNAHQASAEYKYAVLFNRMESRFDFEKRVNLDSDFRALALMYDRMVQGSLDREHPVDTLRSMGATRMPDRFLGLMRELTTHVGLPQELERVYHSVLLVSFQTLEELGEAEKLHGPAITERIHELRKSRWDEVKRGA